ncbi:phospho-sugar mutase [Streptomyces alkaliphilus]|uniref:Phospho-sugar mutase n=1 Tax=Streptomyces alkaliphilus TaxID=1472722 RepID=A0A7W3TE65_9ACTN|nr:phospho-sugar mutase [Streptomyces alkaliphilus]MBB0245191.1 phospho-sugar mutase [Streptomyces alkaliphilus]
MNAAPVGAGAPDPLAAARTWLAEDPDPGTRAELAELIRAVGAEATGTHREGAAGEGAAGTARAELAARFSGTLEFGTAGLRGELGAGPTRMNRAVVIRAAAGLAAYLRDRAGMDPGDVGNTATPGEAGDPPAVVIGWDARHMSERFALDTAAVITGAGLRALLLPRPLPTPVLAFAVRRLGAAAGVMVTASHNPPRDNGYKVYLGDGSQIVPPADADIAARIAAVGPLAGVPRPEGAGEVLGEEIVEAYLERAGTVTAPDSPRGVRVVYTPLHGVGGPLVVEAFRRAGFPEPVVVAEQAEPDPDFPTVAFPNPEEPGAMDLAFATARRERPDLIIASDPDADRCAVAVPDASREEGWRMLRGDDVGALLAAHLIRRGAAGTLAASVVSSSLVERMARAAGLPFRYTLTGFKWLSRVEDLRYGYEEALGYCVDPEGVRDKDGITAALAVAELASVLKEAGRGPTDLLDDLALEHGLHATDQLSVRVADLSLIGAAMTRLRETPPATLAGSPVRRAADLRDGVDGLPPTDGLRYDLSDGRVIVRPSGTEPKLKCYLEVVVPVADREGLPAARAEAARRLAALRSDLAEAAGL